MPVCIDKIALIKKEAHSISDIIGILEGDCLFGVEFFKFFQSLGDTELALLLKMLPSYEEGGSRRFEENEREWERELASFLKKIDSPRRESIEKMAGKIAL